MKDMEKSFFTGDQLAKAVEKLFLLDRFVQWTGENRAEVQKFLNVCGSLTDDGAFKIYKDNGYYEVPVGSWFVKAPDGETYAFGEGVRFVSYGKMLDDLRDKIDGFKIPITRHEEEKPITTFIPEDPYETEVVDEGNAISLRRKLDKDGNPILKKRYSVAVDQAHGKDWSSYRVYESESNKSNWMKGFKNEIDKWRN